MKNYYNILEVSKNASSNDIKKQTKVLINNVKSMRISSEEKKIKLKQLEEAYNFLTDYHKRRSLDEYLENESSIISNSDNLVNPFSMFNSIFKDTNFMNTNIMNNENSKTFYQSSSFTTTVNKDGNLVTEEKVITNNNGDKSESHRIITKDKNGNETIKDVPKNKKSIKYNI
jgi:DnaJ-class molecular chaperone